MMNKREREECNVLRFLAKGIQMAQAKRDGEKHRVAVILSQADFGKWLSLIVDDRREDGGNLGCGSQTALFDVTVVAPPYESEVAE